MKQNTQKLLTWLYTPAGEKLYTATHQQLELLLPDMTTGGRRSLVHYLAQKYLLRTQTVGEQTVINLTSHGKDALEAQFPVFSPALQTWQGQWSALIFLHGPKGDPHFRYLRQLLLDNHAFAFTRGVYLYPGEFPSQIINLCKEMYVGAVTVMGVSQWFFGDERLAIDEHYMLSDIVEIYSGISNEINQLLEQKNEQKRLTKKARLQIYSVFDRFFNILGTDPGFLHHYYPQLQTAMQLLTQLRSMFDVN